MGFLIIGLALLAMHLAGIGPPARWNFELMGDLWKFVLPFVLAMAWWSFSDKVGLTQKRAIRQMDRRRIERRVKAMEALGIHARRDRLVQASREASRRVASEPGDKADLPSQFDMPPPSDEPLRKEPRF